MQIPLRTLSSVDAYVGNREWRDARLSGCPLHPSGGCSFARHGSYARVTPRGLRIARSTDGHDAYPRAIRMELGSRVLHRTNCYLNNRLEQDHRGIKGRCRPILGFKSVPSARRFCSGHDELRNFLRSRSRMCQHVPAATRRFQYMRRTAIALGILEAA